MSVGGLLPTSMGQREAMAIGDDRVWRAAARLKDIAHHREALEPAP